MKLAFFLFVIFLMTLKSSAVLGQVGPDFDLVAWYPLNQNPNNALGTGNNCVNHGAILTTDRFGNPNSAYYFNGSSFLVGDFNTTGFSAMTFTAWIKTGFTSNYEVALQVTGDVCYVNRFTPGHFMGAMDGNSWNNNNDEESNTDVAFDDWIFVGVTNDGSTTKVYVNGNLEKSYSESLWTANSKIEIAGDVGNTTTHFHGSIDDVKIYKRVLTENEINTILTLPDNHDTFAYGDDYLYFNIYPNPSNGIFNISTGNTPLNASIMIYDGIGRLILTDNINGKSKKIDLSTKSSGIYYITLTTQSATLTKKLDLVTTRW